MSAKLTQSVKQFEKKQSEVDEIQGRLKASRERIEELEKHSQNSSSNAQRREIVSTNVRSPFMTSFILFFLGSKRV